MLILSGTLTSYSISTKNLFTNVPIIPILLVFGKMLSKWMYTLLKLIFQQIFVLNLPCSQVTLTYKNDNLLFCSVSTVIAMLM